jgi:hypothetical protein
MASAIKMGRPADHARSTPPRLEEVPDPYVHPTLKALLKSDMDRFNFRVVCGEAIRAGTVAEGDLITVAYTARTMSLVDVAMNSPKTSGACANLLRMLRAQLADLGLTPLARRSIAPLPAAELDDDDNGGQSL